MKPFDGMLIFFIVCWWVRVGVTKYEIECLPLSEEGKKLVDSRMKYNGWFPLLCIAILVWGMWG